MTCTAGPSQVVAAWELPQICTGTITLYIDVMCTFNTSIEPFDVEPSFTWHSLYMIHRHLLGVSRLGLISGSQTHLEYEGVLGLVGMCNGPAIGAECVVGESSKLIGGLLPIVVMMACTGLWQQE